MPSTSSPCQQGGRRIIQQLQHGDHSVQRRVFVCHPTSSSSSLPNLQRNAQSTFSSIKRSCEYSAQGVVREYTTKALSTSARNRCAFSERQPFRTPESSWLNNHQHITVLSTPLFIQSIRRTLSTSSDRGGKNGDKKSDQAESVSNSPSTPEALKHTQPESQDLKNHQGSIATLKANLVSPTVSPAGSPIETKNAEVPTQHNQAGTTQPSTTTTSTATGADASNPQNQKHISSVYAAATNTAHLIGDTLHKNVEVLYHQWYERMEGTMMKSVNESNRRRFRICFFGSIGVIIIVSYVFGDRIRKPVSDQTADIAKETLENESLKIQTQELAMAVVQTVLNDKEITAHAASFLKEASSAAETQQALLELTLHVLQHPQCFQELMILAQKLISDLSADPQVIAKIGEMVIRVSEDPAVKDALSKLVIQVLNDPEVMKEAMNVALAVLARPEVNKATAALLTDASAQVLEDEEIIQQSRVFIADVVGDELLHKEGGNALWKTVYYAMKPGVVRIAGLSLVVVSAAAIRLFMSPF